MQDCSPKYVLPEDPDPVLSVTGIHLLHNWCKLSARDMMLFLLIQLNLGLKVSLDRNLISIVVLRTVPLS